MLTAKGVKILTTSYHRSSSTLGTWAATKDSTPSTSESKGTARANQSHGTPNGLWDYIFEGVASDVLPGNSQPSASKSGSRHCLPHDFFSSSMSSFSAGKMRAFASSPKLQGYRRYSSHAGTRPGEANQSTSSMPLSQPAASSQDRLRARNVWDNLMEDISLSDVAPLPVRNPVPSGTSPVGPMGRPTVRRQAMTREESNIFTDLFDQIFTAQQGFLRSSAKNKDPLSGVGIGRRPGDREPPTVHTLYGKLKRRSKRYHDATDLDNLVEKLRAEIEVIETDVELLAWAVQNIFSTNGLLPDTGKKSRTKNAESATTTTSPDDSPSISPTLISDIDEPTRISTYPHLLSTLIATFRDKFHDPHLSLSIFAYARRLSVPSYVFGCTTTAYNELICTLWRCFKDVHGVVEALQEMKNNGVFPDNHTRNLAMRIRKEAMRTELTTPDTEGSVETPITASNPMLLVYLDRMDELIRPEEKRVEPAARSAIQGGDKMVEVRIPGHHQKGPRPRPQLYQMSDQEDRLELV